jgi:hypothetical protein
VSDAASAALAGGLYSLVTPVSPATHMLLPSKAIPRGRGVVGKAPSLAPVFESL